MTTGNGRLTSFDLPAGRVLGGKYVVESCLGRGWEGEVYKIIERVTDASRTAKLFFPHRNVGDRAVSAYARKLERLRDCPLVIDYHHSETVRVRGVPVTALIGEYVDGALLDRFVKQQRGGRLHPFEALHVLRWLAAGVEAIHDRGEYHGDLHEDNILISRRGIGFDIKLVDLSSLAPGSRRYHMKEDVAQLIRVFYDTLGGAKHYRHHRPEIKFICAGLKRTLIQQRFPTIHRLRQHLETFEWGAG